MPRTPLSAADLPRQPAVFLILLVLARGASHGYRLRADVVRQSDGDVRLDPGSLYRLIARLLEQGLIEEVDAPAGADRADTRRRYYGLTADGRLALRAETRRLEALVQASRAVTPLRARRT